MKTPIKILLIEDDQDDQLSFVEALSEIENATLYATVNNGKEALDRIKNYDFLPDLIVTDIHMPVMDGIECLTEIKKNPHTRNIPVIILSTDTGQIALTRNLGAKTFLKKPCTTEMLDEQIELIINKDLSVPLQILNPTLRATASLF